MRPVLLLLWCASALAAQPLISPGGVVNSASYQLPSLPGGALAQGSIFSIFGTGLGPPSPGVQASEFPLRVTLAGVSVVSCVFCPVRATSYLNVVTSNPVGVPIVSVAGLLVTLPAVLAVYTWV